MERVGIMVMKEKVSSANILKDRNNVFSFCVVHVWLKECEVFGEYGPLSVSPSLSEHI